MNPDKSSRRAAAASDRDTPHENALPLLWRDTRTLLAVMVAGEFLAAILTLALETPNMLDRFAVVSLATQVVVLLTVISLYVARRPLAPLPAPTAAYIAFSLMLASTVVVAVVTRYVFEPVVQLSPREWHSLVWRSVGIVAIAGSLGLLSLQNHWRSKQLALEAKQAQLESLKARVHPHFLFNALNTAVALVHQQPDKAETVLLGLAELVRTALAKPQVVELRDEIDITKAYLDIESLRFGDRLRVQWSLPPELPRVKVPALSLQPLVENAIHHSIERVERGGTVDIALESDPDWILIRVRSPLVLGSERSTPGHGVGVRAAQARVDALTNGAGRVETQTVGEHYVATVRLPRPRPANSRTQVTTR
ncbi:sensor histidine kinase [Cognatilysobacter terrigena]|uniref:sensor histidine kinase n=1 Tax=Cognatilysobacter terrigena TaxID=2488749 RepID=UPI0010621ACD|nr:histidine kinase [Lysobacter terrigena]